MCSVKLSVFGPPLPQVVDTLSYDQGDKLIICSNIGKHLEERIPSPFPWEACTSRMPPPEKQKLINLLNLPEFRNIYWSFSHIFQKNQIFSKRTRNQSKQSDEYGKNGVVLLVKMLEQNCEKGVFSHSGECKFQNFHLGANHWGASQWHNNPSEIFHAFLFSKVNRSVSYSYS